MAKYIVLGVARESCDLSYSKREGKVWPLVWGIMAIQLTSAQVGVQRKKNGGDVQRFSES